MCHSELLKKDKESEDVLVPHIHCLLSPGLPYVAFLISSSLPKIQMLHLNTHIHTLSIQPSQWHTKDLLGLISHLIKAIDAVWKPQITCHYIYATDIEKELVRCLI